MLFFHYGYDGLDCIDGREVVCFEDLSVCGVGEGFDRAEGATAGVGEKCVDAVVGGHCLVDEVLDLVGVGDVGWYYEGGGAYFVDELCDVVEFIASAGSEYGVHAVLCCLDGDGGTDA